MSLTRMRIRSVVWFALSAVLLAGTARAEISPEAIQSLKDEATDVLQLKITKVEKEESEDKSRLELLYTATVLKVDRSSSGTKADSTIQFESYRITAPFAGPKNPPLLEIGWKGTVYLNAPEEKGPYQLAVFGHSFVE